MELFQITLAVIGAAAAVNNIDKVRNALNLLASKAPSYTSRFTAPLQALGRSAVYNAGLAFDALRRFDAQVQNVAMKTAQGFQTIDKHVRMATIGFVALGNIVGTAFTQIIPAMQNFANALKGGVIGAYKSMDAQFKRSLPHIQIMFSKVWYAGFVMRSSLTAAFNGIKTAAGTMGTSINAGLNKVLSMLQQVGAAAARVGSAIGSVFASAAKSAGSSIGGKAGGFFGDTFKGLMAFTGIQNVKESMMESFDVAAERDAQIRGLGAYAKSAKDLEAQLLRLREIAMLPGINLEEAYKGAVRLEATGVSAMNAERALVQFSNALGLVGKGGVELDGVTLALSQIMSKGKLMAQELNQIAERVPQIRMALASAFGTADPEAIQKMGIGAEEAINRIVDALAKLPRASSGLNTLKENMQMIIDEAIKVPFGRGLGEMVMFSTKGLAEVGQAISSIAQQLGMLFSAIGRSGVLSELLAKFGKAINPGNFLVQATKIAGYVFHVLQNIPEYITASWNYVKEFFINLFTYIRESGVAAFKYLGDAIAKLGMQIQVNIAQIAADITNEVSRMSMLPSLIKAIYNPFMKDSEKQEIFNQYYGAELTPQGKAAQAVVDRMKDKLKGMEPVYKGPEFKSPVFKMPKGTESPAEIARRIGEAIRQPGLPEGIEFGGIPSMPQVQNDQLDELKEIKSNTSDMKDLLDLRRQTLGGGALAQIGVQGVELQNQSLYYAGGIIPANSLMEQGFRRMIQQEGRRGLPAYPFGRFGSR